MANVASAASSSPPSELNLPWRERWLRRLLLWLSPGWSQGSADTGATDDDQHQPNARVGPILASADAPGLFSLLRQLSASLGGGHPHEIRLAFLPACGVLDLLDHRGWPKYVLIVGLPCFLSLTVGELRAAIAHELVHLRLRDGVFQRRVVERLAVPVPRPRWTTVVQNRCRVYLQRGAARVSREMEFRADAWAADCCSPLHLLAALEKLLVAQMLFATMLEGNREWSDPTANVYADFAHAWHELPAKQRKLVAKRLLGAEEPDPLAPHPTLKERLTRLRAVHARQSAQAKKLTNATISQSSDDLPPSENMTDESALTLIHDPSRFLTVMHNHLYGARPKSNSVFRRYREG